MEDTNHQLTHEERQEAIISDLINAGRDWEKEFFGEQPGSDRPFVPVDEDITFGIAIKEAIESTAYDWDPKNPKTECARRLFKLVQKRLPKELRGRLLLFCALHSRLDYRFNGDGFFAIRDRERNTAVLIDLTISNPRSNEGRHVVVPRGHFFKKDSAPLKEIAAKIAARFRTKPSAPVLAWQELRRSKYAKLIQNQEMVPRRTARNVKPWSQYNPGNDEDEKPLPTIYEETES